MRRALALLSCGVLAACAAGGTADPTSQAAESEARQEFPGVDVEGLASCVRKNATEDQLAALSLGGKLAEEATAAILSKPETVTCVRNSNIELPS